MAVTAPDLSDQNPVTGQKDPDQNQDAEVGEAVPEIEEILTAAEVSSNPLPEETVVFRETTSLNEFPLQLEQHAGREVVATGPVVWLLRRYWLQSESGHMSILIDVKRLNQDKRNKLKDAVEKIEFLAKVRPRITGTVERHGSEAYHLSATELVFVE